MNDYQKNAIKFVDENAGIFTGVSDAVWDCAELSLKEFKSAKLYCDVLREHGFTVEENLAGIKTAFSGSYGSGRPVIGILGEFDALSGNTLNQSPEELENHKKKKKGFFDKMKEALDE